MQPGLLLSLLLPLRALAQELPTVRYSDLDGLPSADVRDVELADDGSLWFAARGGVVCFDGVRFDSSSVRTGLPFEDTHALCIDSQDRLWVASEMAEHGLAVLERAARGVRGGLQRWRSIKGPTDSADEEFVLELETVVHAGRDEIYLLTLRGRLRFFDGESWRRCELPDDAGKVLAIDAAAGRLACATEGGLFLLDEQGWQALRAPGIDDRALLALRCVPRADGELDVWALGRSGVGVFSGGGYRSVVGPLPEWFLDPRSTFCLQPVGDRVYYGSRAALFVHDPHGRSGIMSPENGLSGAGASALLADPGGGTWVVGPRGITRIPPPWFSNYGPADGLAEREVTALEEWPTGRIVVGHPHALSYLEGGRVTGTRALPEPEHGGRSYLLDMCVAPTGELWLATTRNGVGRLGLDGSEAWWTMPETGAEGSRTAAYAAGIVVDGRGDVWVTGPQGLFRLAGEEFVEVKGDEGAGRGRRIFSSPKDELAIATMGRGIVVVPRTGGWTRWTGRAGLRVNNVYALLWEPDAPPLVGTQAGLHTVDAAGELVEAWDGRIRDPVYFLCRESPERLWIGTDRGVYLRAGERLRRFTVLDGLAGQETNRDASLVDSSGRVWFGTTGGLTLVRDVEPRSEPEPRPRITLGAVEIAGREVDPDVEQTVPPGVVSLLFRVRAADVVSGSPVAMRFRLDGFEGDWSPVQDVGEGRIRYTNLPSGEYALEVQARVQDTWGPVVRSARIRVLPAVWARPWFLVLAGMLVSGSILLVRWLRATRERSHRLTAELASLEHSYREVFHRSRVPQFLLEEGSLRPLDANERGLRLVAQPFEALQAAGLAAALGVDAQRLAEGLRRVTAGGETLLSLVGARRDGRGARRYEVVACHVDLPGLDGLQVTVQDATERRRQEEEQIRDRQLESIGRLAGGIAHDFNNLLTVILGQAGFALARGAEQSEFGEELREIRRAGERGAELVRRLYAYGREQAQEGEVIDLVTVVPEMREVLRGLAGPTVRLEVELPEDTELLVRMDRIQLERVLVNLVVNARDALPSGGTIRIAVTSTDRELDLCVLDDGVGMDAETRERAFEPFFTTKVEQGGTGLGLATVLGIVKHGRGRVEIESEPGAGTRVHIVLPRASAEPEVVPSARESLPLEDQASILFVEDDPVVRTTGARLLERLGHRVQQAADGREALQLLEEGMLFDCLVTDVALPWIDGRELAGRARELHPDLPVLFVSGHLSARSLEDELDGRSRFLPKPYGSADMERALSELWS